MTGATTSEGTLCGMCGAEHEGSPAECPACGADPLVAGRYVLLGVLGRGGTGVTWKARRHPDGALVCLKELRWDRMGSLKDEELFHREAAILKALRHPQIPAYLDDFAWPEPGPRHALWLAQELVDGQSLEAERHQRRYRVDELLAVGEDLALLLLHLGEQRPPVVHRDLKPGNVMRRRDGSLALVDFGAARASGLVERGGTTVAGTFGFMAPEQLRGEASAASDVYALGMTLAVLFGGCEPEDLLDESNRPDLARLADLTPDLRGLLERMLAAVPSERPGAGEVVRRIRALRRGEGPRRPLPPQVRMVRPPPPVRASSAGRTLVLAMTVGILGVAGYAVYSVTRTVDSALELARTSMATTGPPPSSRVNVMSVGPATVSLPTADPKREAEAAREALRASEAEAVREAEAKAAAARALGDDLASCGRGDAAACERTWGRFEGDGRQDLLAADLPATLARACDAGVGQACGYRGALASQGAGVAEDRADARRWYVRACDAGDVATCALSGRMLVDGDAGPVDAKLGVAQLQKACDAKDEVACMNIGVALARGQGIKADRPKALAIFEETCRGGQHLACENLDGLVGNDWGLPSDAKARWATLTRLCDLRVGTACARAGDAAAAGRGTAKDAALALDYRRRACNLGVDSACKP